MTFGIFILARKGSKRLPGKNTMEFTTNKNLVDVAVLKANGVGAGLVVISTDIDDIIHNYDGAGLAAVLERPKKLCGDDISSEDVISHIIECVNDWFIEKIEYFVLIQPTTPLWSIDDFKQAQEEFVRCGYSALVSVNSRYEPNGAFYFCRTKTFLKERTLWPEGTAIFMMPDDRSVDINFLYQFRIAQAINERRIHG